MSILDAFILIMFVLFMIFLVVGFNKQMIDKNKNRKK